MGLSTMGSGLGAIVLGPFISFLCSTYGYFGTILILGGLVLNVAVGGMLYRPLQQHKQLSSEAISLKMPDSNGLAERGMIKDSTNNGQLDEGEQRKSKCYSGICSEGSLLRNWTFLFFCVLMAGMQICIQAFLLFMPAYSLELGATQTQASLLVTFYGGADVVGRIIFGVSFDVATLRPYRVYIYCVMSAIFGLLAISVSLTTSYISCAVLTAMVGMVQSCCHGQRATVVGDIVSKSQLAKGVGFLMFSQGLGSITGAPIAGRYHSKQLRLNLSLCLPI